MIYKNIDFYNVSEFQAAGRENAYKMLRVPSCVADKISEGGQRMNCANCGVELRFNMISDTVKLNLCFDAEGKVTRPVILYGNIPAGWEECFKNIYYTPTEIIIKKPSEDSMRLYEKIATENNHPFDPHVIRVIMQNNHCYFIDITEGIVKPPTPDQVPKARYLAYGSSITHGSLALLQINTYAYRVAENLGHDLINLGFAGNARLEKEMADYIASRDDWDFASLEMGINILDIPAEEFRERVTYFIETVAKTHPSKKVFCIDLFYCKDDLEGGGKASSFRKIVKETVGKLGLPNTVYVNGLEMLTGSHGLSGDLVHPNVRGAEEISQNLSKLIKSYI
ncbi:MAG: SGNH/GDSL hydrolase family protein [Bacillota bacterium]|nr:SGNH/GDSL hydrolase family protein [Bacillota bacterium]